MVAQEALEPRIPAPMRQATDAPTCGEDLGLRLSHGLPTRGAAQKPGFRKPGEAGTLGAPTAVVWRARDLVDVPALEELITACGDHLGEIARLNNGSFQAAARDGRLRQAGRSPTEAVARPWLAINGVRE